jgi:hypothetical protein
MLLNKQQIVIIFLTLTGEERTQYIDDVENIQ